MHASLQACALQSKALLSTHEKTTTPIKMEVFPKSSASFQFQYVPTALHLISAVEYRILYPMPPP